MRRALKAILPIGAPILPAVVDVETHLKVFEADRARLKGTYLDEQSRFFDDLNVYPDTRTEIAVSNAELADWVEKASRVDRNHIRQIRGGI
jgi:hypothetical protein